MEPQGSEQKRNRGNKRRDQSRKIHVRANREVSLRADKREKDDGRERGEMEGEREREEQQRTTSFLTV